MQRRAGLRLVAVTTVLTVLLGAGPRASAAGSDPMPETAAGLDAEAMRSLVIDRLVSLGLTRDDAEARVSRLTSEDLQQLASHPEQLAMGGVKDKTLIIIAAILVIPSILLLFAF